MTDQNSNEPQTCSTKKAPANSPGDSRYTLLVTGLLVVIIVALSVLWLRERSQRLKYHQQMVQLQKALEEAQTRAMFAALGGGTSVDAVASKIQLMAEKPQFEVVREELATIPMTVNGKPRQVLQLSGTIAARAGFIPGDLIYVTEPPAGRAKKIAP